MSGKRADYQLGINKRPIVGVRLENPHDSSVLPIEMPALIDTGADSILISASLCPLLGHSFEHGFRSRPLLELGQGQCGHLAILRN
jgi:hypothetical protein